MRHGLMRGVHGTDGRRTGTSCTLLAAKADGHRITTIEGLQKEMEELGKAMTEEGAEQCGYCSPGLAVMILWLKKNHPHASDEEITHLLTGNLCRCSGYAGQLRGIRRYLGGEKA